ncbi:MAG: nuclear transport factor 2 family protein [Solirubrobacterales bacterium]|nr:nuclear transport factor 2 family protein [Solirubrobacterales bacterium]
MTTTTTVPEPPITDDVRAVGARFAHALAAKDFEAFYDLLHPDVNFVALTPGRVWPALGPAKGIDGVLRHWLDGITVERLSDVQVEQLSDCRRLGYRLHGRSGGRSFVFEQQAYLQETGGQISWVRLLCSGLRPPILAGPELSATSSDGNAEAIAGPGRAAV